MRIVTTTMIMKYIGATIAVLTGILGLSLASPVFALTVSPTILEIQGDPGAVLNGSIDLYNDQTENQKLYVSFENFEPDGESGAPRFVGGTEGLATWLDSVPSLEIPVGEHVQAPFHLNIPADAEPGGYFAAIFFGTQAPEPEKKDVTIGGRVGVLLLVRVNGDIPESAGVTEFTTRGNKTFFTTLPIGFQYRLGNAGGDRVVPVGEIIINNSFGKERARIIANPSEGSVLPGSARKFVTLWGDEEEMPAQGFFSKAYAQLKHFHMGWYHAELELGWGREGHSSHDRISFVMIPWQLLVLIIGGFTILFLAVKRGLSAYKKSLMQELTKQHHETNQGE